MRLFRNALAAALAGSLALSGGWLAPVGPAGAAVPGPLRVRVGQAEGLTHIDFPGLGPSSVRRDGADLVLTFTGASPSEDLARLRIDPTNLIADVKTSARGRSLEVRMTLAKGVQPKIGRADGAFVVSLLAPPQSAPAAAAAPAVTGRDQAPASRPDPAPPGGRLRVKIAAAPDGVRLMFPWRAPLGSAVFRRGDILFIVFDTRADLDLSALPKRGPYVENARAMTGRDFSAARLRLGPGVVASATVLGGEWTIAISRQAPSPAPVKFGRDDLTGPPSLTAQVAGATGVFWMDDPDAGDRLVVVTALGPAKGVLTPRTLVDADVLASDQGLALTPKVDDLTVTTDGDIVRIGRAKGLALSPPTPRNGPTDPALGAPGPAGMPALVDFEGWSRTGSATFLARYDQLQTAAAEEAGKGKSAGVGARLALARFLIGSELAYEGLGALQVALKADQTLAADAEFRGLRGAARAMAGRFKEAQADFSAPVLADDPASALWRGYADEKLGDHAGARQAFAQGRSAMGRFPERWRGRFARLDAEAALGVNDLNAARSALDLAGSLKVDPDDAMAIQLDKARVLEASGRRDEALPLYDAVAGAANGGLATPAALHAVQIRYAEGKLTAPDAEAALNSLRFRWRGDETELETVRALADLYIAQGRYRDALEALRSANGRLPDRPAAIAISSDLSTIFKALFLNGGADGLQPIQALALFYDFKDLTPIGADGDEMVRKLVKRLVDVDLLDQAAELLKYQMDNRLDGVARAQVATDLAMIDLMNKKPEDALDAINGSRTTILPTPLNMRRRILEARAHLALGRYDNALELLQGQKGPEVDAVRAEVAWRQKNWSAAGPAFEAELGDRWKNPAPLTGEEEGRLVRAGAAYSLAGDDKALKRLRDRFGRLGETSSAPSAVKVALAGLDGGQLSTADFVRAASDDAVFAGWIADMKKRFATEPSPFSGGAVPRTTAGSKVGPATAAQGARPRASA